MMLYMGYLYLTNTSLSIGVQSLDKATSVEWTKLQNPSSSTYHYEGWVYIKTKPTKDTSILERDYNKLQLNGTILTFQYNTDAAADKITITEDFPLQKWVYIVVNVVNKNIVEVYLNGKLVITKQLTDIKVPGTKTQLTYGVEPGSTNGMVGYITKVKRDPVALTPDEVSKTYFEGNGLATFTNFLAGYNASFSLFNTEGTIKEYTAL
jgi:hypothetical protein